MSNVLAFIVTIARAAGTKLPLIWPYLTHIAADLAEIAKILGTNLLADISFGKGSAGPESAEDQAAELESLCASAGVDAADCAKVVESAAAADKE